MTYTNDEEPPQWSKDDDLPDVRLRLAEREHHIRELALQVEFARAIRELGQTSGWKALIARLHSIEHDETRRLCSDRMDSYELGRRQGLLQALRHVTNTTPRPQEEIDNAVAEIRLLEQLQVKDRELLK